MVFHDAGMKFETAFQESMGTIAVQSPLPQWYQFWDIVHQFSSSCLLKDNCLAVIALMSHAVPGKRMIKLDFWRTVWCWLGLVDHCIQCNCFKESNNAHIVVIRRGRRDFLKSCRKMMTKSSSTFVTKQNFIILLSPKVQILCDKLHVPDISYIWRHSNWRWHCSACDQRKFDEKFSGKLTFKP